MVDLDLIKLYPVPLSLIYLNIFSCKSYYLSQKKLKKCQNQSILCTMPDLMEDLLPGPGRQQLEGVPQQPHLIVADRPNAGQVAHYFRVLLNCS